MRPTHSLIVAALLLSTTACDKLKGLAKKDESAAPSASASAAPAPSASAAVTAAATADPAPSATAAADNEPLTLPGSCVDADADALKRMPSKGNRVTDKIDVDGDGKADKVIRLDLGEVPSPNMVYVMRGTCGHFVGQFDGTAKVSGLKSKGLKSFDVVEKNVACTDDCTCKDKSIAYFFNGTKYAAGKSKELTRPCTKPTASASAAPSASGSSKPAATGQCKLKPGAKKKATLTKGVTWDVTVLSCVGPGQVKVKINESGETLETDEDSLF